ncbi:hypothetical protein BG003_001979 [Podila horticola]|nr:hypothetical protein BG003_001979 [Podila horticola]
MDEVLVGLVKCLRTRIQVMRSILYLAAALAVVGITLAAPAPAPVEVAEKWCYCEPDFRGQKPRKSPDCCYEGAAP